MKAILMSDRSKWCALMMNDIKKIEVRKGTALYKAIQKLIDEYGYADIYVYCTKEKPYFFESDWSDNDGKYSVLPNDLNKAIEHVKSKWGYGKEYLGCPCILYGTPYGNLLEKRKYYSGKIIFKFRCYRVEEIKADFSITKSGYYGTHLLGEPVLEKTSCLTHRELNEYLKGDEKCNNIQTIGTAIHISDLEIFDKPKELSEFKQDKKFSEIDYMLPIPRKETCERLVALTKAPQSWCYVEVI